MKRFFSRFSREYDRSLLYMLQASEYNVHDYFDWYRRIADFRFVQRRKKIVWTTKVKALWATEWIPVGAAALFGIWLFGLLSFASWLVVGALLALLVTLVLPVWLALVVVVGRLVQWPIEQWMIAQAKTKLSKHRAFKIAIAGSFGKTSMREILRAVLSEGPSTSLGTGKKIAAPGDSENTPIAIARFIQGLKGDEEILVFELGEYYPGDVRKLCRVIRPDLGFITGVNEAHLSKFGTLELAADTVFELAEFVPSENLYVNGENQTAALQSARSTVHFSREGVGSPAGGWKVVAAETSLDGTSFVLEKGTERINAQSKLLGLHQIGPLAAAAAVASRLGLTKEQIEKGIAKTKAFAHRLERRDDLGVITLDDSYNGNPDGVAAVIEFLASISGHRRWYVTPGLVEMGDRSEAIHKNIGRQLTEAGIEKVVLIKNSVTPWIEQGLKEDNFQGEVIWFDDALKCYESLPHMTVAGDVVLLQNDWPDQYA